MKEKKKRYKGYGYQSSKSSKSFCLKEKQVIRRVRAETGLGVDIELCV